MIAICVVPSGIALLLTAVVIFIATRGAPELKDDDIVNAIVGAIAGVVLLFLLRSFLERLVGPVSMEFDVLLYYIVPLFGSFLGAATLLLRSRRRVRRPAAARSMLLFVSLVVIPFQALELQSFFSSPQRTNDSWQHQLFWLSDPLLPILWVIVLWAIWWWKLRGVSPPLASENA